MKIGFIIPILNAADHLAGVLAQINDHGKTVVIEFIDSTVNDLDSCNGRSHDDSYEITEAFDGVDFICMGKIKDRCSALNKGLNILEDAEYIVILQQGDFILDFQYLLDELQYNDVIFTRRFRYWDNFNEYFLGNKEEIAFKNIRNFGKLRYTTDPFSITSSDGHALREHNVKTSCIDNVIVNFNMITSQEKRERMIIRDAREKIYFIDKNKCTQASHFEDVRECKPKIIDDNVSFLNLVPHPWREKDSSFYNGLKTFPSIDVNEWRKCLGSEYTSAFGDIRVVEKPKVLGLNNHSLASQFESEGWEYHTIPDDKFDLIFSVGIIPDINYISTFLKESGKIIIIDSKKLVNCPEYETIFLRENNKLFSYALMKGSQNG